MKMSIGSLKIIKTLLTTEHMFSIINSVTIKKRGVKLEKEQYDDENLFTFPDEQEMKTAQKICCGRVCTECETPAEYAWRKRDVDMSLLLEEAIGKELSEIEKNTVTDYWFESLSVSEIARLRGIAPSAVSVTLSRAQGKLERVLGYTVKYQRDLNNETVIPLALGRARVIAAARKASYGSVNDRIRRLRQSENLSRDALGKAVGISPSRLTAIENGNTLADSREIIAVSEFFNVTTDFILKGD